MEDYTLVTKKASRLEVVSQTNFLQNKIYISENIGINSESGMGSHNYTIFKFSDDEKLTLHFMIYKIQTRHFININNTHIIELDIFFLIETMIQFGNTICIKHSTLGEIVLERCDMDMVNKFISVVQQYKKNNKKTFYDYFQYMFT